MEHVGYKKTVARYLLAFELFKESNLVVFLHKKLERNAIKKWLFMALPVVCYTLNLIFIITDEAFWSNQIPLSYVKDMSNSLGLSVLYFISYFLSRHFPSLFEEWLKYGISRDYENELREMNSSPKWVFCIISFVIGIILFVVGFLAGFSFCFQAMKNGDRIWINHLGDAGKIYYNIFLGITWYQSLSLLGMALMAGFVIFWSIRDNAITYELLDFNNNLSIIKAVDVLLCTFSYGLFYIVGSLLFILNDKVAAQKPIEVINAFDKDVNALILVVSVLMIVCVAFIPLQEMINFMQNQKMKLIIDYNEKIKSASEQSEKDALMEKRNDVMNQPPILTSLSNKILIVMSVLIPLIGVIFQGIELYK